MATAKKAKKTVKAKATVRGARSPSRVRGALALPTLSTRLGARTEFRIYPSIGVARIGDCSDSFMIGPEAPGQVSSGPFRGADHGIKPQAARFRIYKVEVDDGENEVVTEEIVAGSGIEIEWTVSLANRKAAGFRIGDTLGRAPNPGLRNNGLDRSKLVISADGSVAGAATKGPVLSGEIEFANPNAAGTKVSDIVLAKLKTDDAGRLLVVGGPGTSGSPLNASINVFSDNDGWYDSVSDGPVSASLRINGQSQAVVPAWVLVTVPRYAPGIQGIVTWYDQAVNMARTGSDGRFTAPRTTSFTHDVYPILSRADHLSGVHGTAHANGVIRPLSDAARLAGFSDPAKRKAIAQRLTQMAATANGPEQLPPGTMPRLFSGANPASDGPTFTFLALTRYQLAHIDNWVNGNFNDDWPGSAPAPVPFADIPVARQAWALCEAALENCVGGSFYPGIEGTYDIARIATYHPQPNLRSEFRIDPAHPAGFLTEKMALPWQADFVDCSNFWWPSQRPDDVTPKTGGAKVRWDRGVADLGGNRHLNMVESWSELGFVVFDPAAGKFVEDERTLGAPVA
ncbi:LodA/GoxA family CTQ-dependent oxidase [Bradyrhizobium liaoningense]|uniref:LodA/GoxA family CTQ-dependent oxidase n=1 Tax=Bradyrhizobium liaoningense TaxID=43992 RepID=UPI001BABDE31|nr:LodA/GoxA family CTQ-dependent oxidase [Bradyrhizobium liaoningense]MBR0718651.1 LodA/GoxA family CTQ-dependent oxidase [Bradyrhizobium liaoningense]